jgi:hypothetical protein
LAVLVCIRVWWWWSHRSGVHYVTAKVTLGNIRRSVAFVFSQGAAVWRFPAPFVLRPASGEIALLSRNEREQRQSLKAPRYLPQ